MLVNFDTTEESLKAEFSVIGDVRSVVIMKKPNTKTTGKDAGKAMLSMGYGFVEYLKPEFALEALKKLQHVVVDGHKLEIKISNRESKVSQKNAKRKGTEMEDVSKISKLVPSTKLLVKNLAFEATTKDLRQLFGTFGQVRFCKMLCIIFRLKALECLRSLTETTVALVLWILLRVKKLSMH